MKEFIIETRGLTKSFKNLKALNHVSLHVAKGEIYGLIGDNGAGKSTLLKALAGELAATSGSVRLFGQEDEASLRAARKKCGILIDDTPSFPYLRVDDAVDYYRRLKGIPGASKTAEVLKRIGIYDKRRSRCKSLSMGQRKRLGLAIALLGEPEVLILDEPINGLDPTTMVEFRQILHELNEEKGVTILLSSHILSELDLTATTFGFIDHGEMLAEVSADTLHDECREQLNIAVDDTEKFTAMVDRFLPEEDYRVLADKTVQFLAPSKEAIDYSRLAAANGILITAMEWKNLTLEDYFLNLKKEARHA